MEPIYTDQIQMPVYHGKLKRAKELNIQYKNVFAPICPRGPVRATEPTEPLISLI